jgi:hypothetical protein
MIRKVPLGKQVRSAIYVHRDYESKVIPDQVLEVAKAIVIINNFDYDVVKWDKHTNKVSFIYSPNFRGKFEPEIESVITVDLKKGTYRQRKYVDGTFPNSNCPIYHHTWLMVPDDYPDSIFVSRGKIRSAEIEEVISKHRIDKRKIGFKKYWTNIFIPLLLRERAMGHGAVI